MNVQYETDGDYVEEERAEHVEYGHAYRHSVQVTGVGIVRAESCDVRDGENDQNSD